LAGRLSTGRFYGPITLAESDAGRPIDPWPVDPKSIDSRPVDLRSVDCKPVDSQPVDL